MRAIKKVKEFFFNGKSHREIVDIINKRFPINLSLNQELIDRIASKYPIIPKHNIVSIITLFFQSIRECLILGKTLCIIGFLTDVRLHFLMPKRTKAIKCIVKITTPPGLRKIDKNEKQDELKNYSQNYSQNGSQEEPQEEPQEDREDYSQDDEEYESEPYKKPRDLVDIIIDELIKGV